MTRAPQASNTWRLLASCLLTLISLSACYLEVEESEVQAPMGEPVFRTKLGTVDLDAVNPSSGKRLNTNQIRDWAYSNMYLGPFDGNLPPGVVVDSIRLSQPDPDNWNPFSLSLCFEDWWPDELAPDALISRDGNGVLEIGVEDDMLVGYAGGILVQHSDFDNSIWTVSIDAGVYGRLSAELELHVGWSTDRQGALWPDVGPGSQWNRPCPGVPGVGEDGEDYYEREYRDQDAIPLYEFVYRPNALPAEWPGYDDSLPGDPVPTCAIPADAGLVSTAAVVFEGVHVDDGSGGGPGDGSVHPISDTLYFGCLTGAAGKAALWGYWPNAPDLSTYPSGSLINYETAVRVVRSDRCADGKSHTKEGTSVGFADTHGLGLPQKSPMPSTNDQFEAVWRDGRAYCVNVDNRFAKQQVERIYCPSTNSWIPRCDELELEPEDMIEEGFNGASSLFTEPGLSNFVTW